MSGSRITCYTCSQTSEPGKRIQPVLGLMLYRSSIWRLQKQKRKYEGLKLSRGAAMEVELTNFIAVSFSILFFLLAFKLLVNKTRKRVNLPPSPFGLPIFGHLHLLKHPIHRSLQELSHKHGGIFSLRLGSRLMVVVSSPSAVEECFTKNDIIFANRPDFVSGKYLTYGKTTLGAASYGDHWRNLRRLSSVEIFSTNRLNASTVMRKDEVRIFLQNLYRASAHGFSKIELKSRFSELTFNMIMRMVAGKRYYGEEVGAVKEAKEFRELMTELFSLSSYPGDFLPFLKWVDGQGYLKKVERLGKRTDKFLQGLLDESRSLVSQSGAPDTMINHLVCLQKKEPEYYSDDMIKGMIVTMLSAATETSSVTLEWAMSNMLNHPETLSKVKAELDFYLGQEGLVEELDLPNLHYLQNVIAETLRLYPPAPLLAPHLSSQSCTLGGYHIPGDTMIMVNAWAIHRDPKVWEDSGSFKPERFESGRENDSYRSLPFGLGRRACPGMGMANRVVGLTLGSLIRCFEWKRMDEEVLDMKEGQGLSMPKVVPLECLCKPRPIMHKILPQISPTNN